MSMFVLWGKGGLEMARYNGLIIPRSYNDYFSRSDPQAIRDIVSLAADGELNAESKNPLQNQAIAKIVPTTASPENKLIVQSQVSGLTADVETIKNIIPNTASETNELADKNFVNSTVGTNTANYIYKTESGGEKVPFSSVAELEAYAGTVTNNDYAFVTGIDENGNAYYDRYKADVNDGVVTWAKEYRLNNSSFTAEQWAAIQSGITAEKVAQFEGAVSPVDVVQSGNMSAVTSNAVNGALAEYKYYSIRADVAPNLTTLKWDKYYAPLPIPVDVNEILMCSMFGFTSTNNGLRYQLAIGQNKKSLYVAKVNKNDTITDEEGIGYMILYR